jgi:hypothetical protein
MATGSQVNPIIAKHAAALNKASAEVANEVPPVTARGVLPMGVDNGLARLVEIKFGEFQKGDNQGKPYALPMGVCKFPKSVGDVITEGLYTSLNPIPLCDTGKPGTEQFVPMKENLKELTFVAKRLMGWKQGDDVTPYVGNNLWSTIAHLNATRPTFRFKTWGYQKEEPKQLPNGKWTVFVGGQQSKRKPKVYPTLDALKADPANKYIDREPRINHEWGEAVDVPDEVHTPGAGTEYTEAEGHDDMGADLEVPEEAPAPVKTVTKVVTNPAPRLAPATVTKPGFKKPAPKPEPEPEPEPVVEYSDDEDLASLGERADNGDSVAEGKLIEFATAAGIEQDAEGNFPGNSWAELATMIAEGGVADGDEAAEDEGAIPQVGETWMAMVVRNGKKEKGEVEILTSAEGFVTAKDLVTGRPVKDPKAPKNNLKIAYSDLEPVDA